MKIEAGDWYRSWSGQIYVVVGVHRLTVDEARELRDDLTKTLEEITQDEEQEP